MNVSSNNPNARMSALSFLYDNIHDLPAWFRRLTPGQLEDIASVMVRWQIPAENHSILPMEEIERREILRAIAMCGGNVTKAADALGLGKTTIYNKLRKWGFSVENRTLQVQAAVLAGDHTHLRRVG